MVNKNIRRITVAGKVVEATCTRINDKYFYKVDIEKVDGGIWTVKVDESIFFKLRKNSEAIFDLAIVFKNDNIYEKVDNKLSKIEGVRIKGKNITEAEYDFQVDIDKSWLLNEENLKGIEKQKKKQFILSASVMLLIAIYLGGMAIYTWKAKVIDGGATSVFSYYILNIIGVVSVLGIISWIVYMVNETAARFLRLTIPIGLIAMSVWVAIEYGVFYHIGTFLFSIMLIIMLFVRMKNGFVKR